MTVWRLEITREFEKDLKKRDKHIRQRIALALDDIVDLDDPRSPGKGLSGNLAGYWRYHISDYRILVLLQDDRMVVLGVGVSHRSGVYDK